MRHITVGRPEDQRRDLVIVAVLLIASWTLASLDSSQTLGLTRAMRDTVLRPFLAADAVYERTAGLATRAASLELERDSLYRELQLTADLQRENRELRTLLDIPERVPGDYSVVELVPGRPTVGDVHAFLVRGSVLASLETPTAVSVPAGLVGVLRSAAGSTGLGEFWTHPEFRVSVRSIAGDATGIIRAIEVDRRTTLMLVEGVPYEASVPAGTILETTGLGGVFPPGIRVGTVIEEAEARSGWSHGYLVRPAVRPGGVRAVTVWRRATGPFGGQESGSALDTAEAMGGGGGRR